ncbi:hypothetical protein CA267_001910 [Alteromonas pelagimontana]|uniref:Uncharacterized protein n=1 Tax=Alteromonas pelagimontana TaxID=1858656 RepID=A0A6M4M9J1_9ALTE|nr:hypothetical protein [Alteromonas pelagimontana]QJR79639.1 hypothetical protein CA267_001910 [Alteromonas pelagimontana]
MAGMTYSKQLFKGLKMKTNEENLLAKEDANLEVAPDRVEPKFKATRANLERIARLNNANTETGSDFVEV